MTKAPEAPPTIEDPFKKEEERIRESLFLLDVEIEKFMNADNKRGDKLFTSARPLLIQWIIVYESEYLPAFVAARDPVPGFFDASINPLTSSYATNLRILLFDEIPEEPGYLFDKAEQLRVKKTN